MSLLSGVFMKKTSLYSVLMVILGATLLVAFNNCSNSFQSEQLSSGGLSSNTLSSLNASELSIEEGNLANEPGQPNARTVLFPSSAAGSSIKVHVAKSLNGPWVENGKICRNQASYIRTSGINLSVKTKGCASKANDTACLNASNHRDFTASEVSTGNIVTVVSVNDSNSWPLGDYVFYLNQHGLIKAVGSTRLENCSSGSASPSLEVGVNPGNSSSCAWSNLSFGGGSTRKDPATACTAAMHYKNAVDGNGIQQTCFCSNLPAPDPGPTYGYLAAPSFSKYRLTPIAALTGNGQQRPHPVNTQCAYGATYSGYQNCQTEWQGVAPDRYLICQGWTQACNANPN